jgi:hypothetical protein
VPEQATTVIVGGGTTAELVMQLQFSCGRVVSTTVTV